MTIMTRSHQKSRFVSFLLRGAILFAITIALGLMLGYAIFARSNYIVDGTSVDGINIGNMRRTAALTKLQSSWREKGVVLVAGEQRFDVPVTELGIEIDAQTIVQEAYNEGRDGWLAPLKLLWTTNREIMPKYIVDSEMAEMRFGRLSAEIDTAPQPAYLAKENGVVIIVAGQAGQALDVDATASTWENSWQNAVKAGTFELATTAIASPVADLTPLAAEANSMLAQPIQLTAYDPMIDEAWEIAVSREEWASWLDFSAENNTLKFTVNENVVDRFLDAQFDDHRYFVMAEMMSQLLNGGESAELQLYRGERIHTVQSGETLSSIGYDYGMPYPWLQASNPNVDQLRIGQEIVIPSPDDLIPLPIVREKRLVVSITDQHLWAYQNGQLVWEYPISTGIADSPTSPGVFQIQSHELNAYANSWDLHMPYFMGIYRPAPNIDFMNGFHGFPTRDGTNLLWTNSLGRPATYGCVLVGNNVAEQLYTWAEEGVIVEVLP